VGRIAWEGLQLNRRYVGDTSYGSQTPNRFSQNLLFPNLIQIKWGKRDELPIRKVDKVK
jgi:hypothetical protein